jgi:hypothetical protein
MHAGHLARVVSPRLTYLKACSLLEPNPLQRPLALSVDRFEAFLESPTYFGAKLDEEWG